jgi:hypothetical protein
MLMIKTFVLATVLGLAAFCAGSFIAQPANAALIQVGSRAGLALISP